MCKVCDELRARREAHEKAERERCEMRNAEVFGSPLGPGLCPLLKEGAVRKLRLRILSGGDVP